MTPVTESAFIGATANPLTPRANHISQNGDLFSLIRGIRAGIQDFNPQFFRFLFASLFDIGVERHAD
jgi:hypothetical protein